MSLFDIFIEVWRHRRSEHTKIHARKFRKNMLENVDSICVFLVLPFNFAILCNKPSSRGMYF
jgi:hypothetical protein